MQGKKNDFLDDKLRWDLLPLEEIEEIVKVYTAGSKKYGDNNWQALPNGVQRYKAALLRHLVEFEKGNEVDEETGCKHLAQVAWNAIAMLYLSKNKKEDLLSKLDKRIEEKIASTNQLLDEVEKMRSKAEIERIKNIEESRKLHDRSIEETVERLSDTLKIKTDGKYSLSIVQLYPENNLKVTLNGVSRKLFKGLFQRSFNSIEDMVITEISNRNIMTNLPDLEKIVEELINKYENNGTTEIQKDKLCTK